MHPGFLIGSKWFQMHPGVFKCIWVFSITSRCFQLHPSVFNYIQVLSNATGCFQLHPSIFQCIQMFANATRCFQMYYNVDMKYVKYFCSVSCRVTWLILINVSIWSSSRTTDLPERSWSSKYNFLLLNQLKKNSLSYGTISENGTYSFCCYVQDFTSQKDLNITLHM